MADCRRPIEFGISIVPAAATLDEARTLARRADATRFVTDLGFDTFVFWPNEDPVRQVERFAAEVVPGVREQVARARR